MTSARRLHYAYAEYLAMLAETHLKLEYYEGSIYAMAGGTREHAALSVAVASLLRDAAGWRETEVRSDEVVALLHACGRQHLRRHRRHPLSARSLLNAWAPHPRGDGAAARGHL